MTLQPTPRHAPRWRRLFAALIAVAGMCLATAAIAGDLSPSVLDAAALFGLTGAAQPTTSGAWYLGPGRAPGEVRAAVQFNLNAADTINVEQLLPGGSSGLNLTGAGVVIGMWDSGAVRATHQEFGGRVTVVDPVATSNHATHVAGILAAAGVDPGARGMAPAATIRSLDFVDDKLELADDAPLLDVSNHSYGNLEGWTTQLSWSSLGISGGVDTWVEDRSLFAVEDPNFGKYDAGAQAMDRALHDNPHLLSVWAAGNDRINNFANVRGDNQYVTYFSSDPGGIGFTAAGWYLVPAFGNSATVAPPNDGGATGFDTLPGDQTAKNNLVVGAISDLTIDPYADVDVALTTFTSFGPTDDGRIKPDLVANGTGLFSASSVSDSVYSVLTGTSMAAPSVAGAAALLVEHYRGLHAGQSPTSATLKGALIHTAFDIAAPGPDYQAGWGVADAAAAASFLGAAAAPLGSDRLLEGDVGVSEFTLAVVADGGPFKATLVWTDPAAATLPSDGLDDSLSVLAHDLDLYVTGPDGEVYWPWTLDPFHPTVAAVRTAANTRDNVEQVVIDFPWEGLPYTIHIAGGDFTQRFSLLYSAAHPVPEPATMGLAVLAAVAVTCVRRCRRSPTSRAPRGANEFGRR